MTPPAKRPIPVTELQENLAEREPFGSSAYTTDARIGMVTIEIKTCHMKNASTVGEIQANTAMAPRARAVTRPLPITLCRT